MLDLYDYYRRISEEIRSEYAERYKYSYDRDGVLRPDIYFDGKTPRVMMLMKEGIDSWSLVDKIDNTEQDDYKVVKPEKNAKQKNSSTSWANNIIRSVHFIHKKEWKDNTDGESVTGFAYINLKKHTEGNKSSDDSILDRSVNKDKELLYKQITACVPDIVFCCQHNKNRHSKQLDRLKNILNSEPQNIPGITFAQALPYSSQGIQYKLLAIDWVHPSWSSLSKKEQKERLKQLKQWIDKAVEYNRRQEEKHKLQQDN